MSQQLPAIDPERLTAFFVGYGEALAGGDLAGISGCYAVPALIVHDRGVRPIAAHAEIEASFEGAADRYRAEGLVAARPTVTATEPLTTVLLSVDVHWDYCDEQGSSRQQDGYRYILRLTDAGPLIQVVIATPPA